MLQFCSCKEEVPGLAKVLGVHRFHIIGFGWLMKGYRRVPFLIMGSRIHGFGRVVCRIGRGLQKHEFEGWLMLGHDAGLL